MKNKKIFVKKLSTYIKWDNSEVTEDLVNNWKNLCLLEFKSITNKDISIDDIFFDNFSDGQDFIKDKVTYRAFLYVDQNGIIVRK